MKMSRAFIICFFTLFLIRTGYSQKENNTVATSVAIVINNDLINILDNAVHHEKKCAYFSDSLPFTINVRLIKHVYELQIESLTNINDAFDYFEPIYGCLYHRNHLFFIYGTDASAFFLLTGQSENFKSKSHTALENQNAYQIVGGSFSIWNYWHYNNTFYFRGISSNCE
jgi:hypothetical protein